MRYPRRLIISDDSLFHVTWQCHNNSFFLEERWSKELYRRLLIKYKARFGIVIYSYCFMSSHPHLAGHCETREGLSKFMQVVNTRFAVEINRVYGRKGQAVRDRFKSPQIESPEHLWNVLKYIDLNPVKAGLVERPEEFEYSSYRFYAFGESDPLVDACPAYLELAGTPEQRQRMYRSMVEAVLNAENSESSSEDDPDESRFGGLCIGNPTWVFARYEEIRAYRRAESRARTAPTLSPDFSP